MGTYIPLLIATWVVISVVVFQFISFTKTRNKINELMHLFPEIDALKLVKTSISIEILDNKRELNKFLRSISPQSSSEYMPHSGDEQYADVSLLYSEQMKSGKFSQIILRTNEYLSKNAGTSADFEILKDICEDHVEILENEIRSTLNTPLYLGLAGTFTGIIVGLWGIDFNEIINGEAGSLDGLQHLLYGVVAAMSASLLGLLLTICNSAYSYKKAIGIIDSKKEDYYSFIRRELMPVLSNSMASSLNSLKGVLGHFVDKFGRNLDAYADAADLLNDNLEKQHLVLSEINKLSLTKTANEIANTFMTLKDSASSLSVFKAYQDQLNSTIKNITDATTSIQSIISKFNEFSAGLSVVVSNQNKATMLQEEFKNAIETHFPTGSEGRDIWRKEFDLLMGDAQQISGRLSEQLTVSTEYISRFVSENQAFFESFKQLRQVLDTLVQYTNVQAECYKDLKSEILSLRKEYNDAQKQNADLSRDINMAVKTLIEVLKDLKSN